MMLKYVPLIPTFLRVFIKKGCCILSSAFFASIERVMWFLPFIAVMNHVNCFADIEPALHPRYKSHLVVVNNFLNVLLERLANILLRIFASMFIREIGL